MSNSNPTTKSTGTINDPIALLTAGGTDTLLSARKGNQLIRMANAVRQMKADPQSGIKVIISDEGIMIDGSQLSSPPTTTGTSVYGLFPFRVYLAQLALSNPTGDATNWWRTFLIRCGEVAGEALSGDGCDGYDSDPYSDVYPVVVESTGAPVVPITCADNVINYYFWIELTLENGPQLRSGTNPATAIVDEHGNEIINAWTTWPVPDGLHFMLAEVNTQTNSGAKGPAIVRQYLAADIPKGLPTAACDETGASLWIDIPFAYQQTPPH
jgi:hypothetical protein